MISCRFLGATVCSAISRSATTGFLSRSRSMVSSLPPEIFPCALGGEQDKVETVRNLVDAIFQQ